MDNRSEDGEEEEEREQCLKKKSLWVMKIAKIIRIASIFCYVNSYITRLPRVSAHAPQFSLSQSPYRGVPNPDAELNQDNVHPIDSETSLPPETISILETLLHGR